MKILKIAIKITIFSSISLFFIIMGLYLYAYISPSIDLKSPNNIQILDKDNKVIKASSKANWTKLKDINDNLINAVISIEDKNFYHHHGFDYLRIIKAMIENIKNKSIVQGASTISQQYVKNLYLNFSKTWKRKADEAMLTLELESHYSKDEILEGYLNTINYGQGNYGITMASNYYFGKEPKYLTLEESLLLAGIPKNPGKYNLITNYDECVKRAKLVAKAMKKNGLLDSDNNLFSKPVTIVAQDEKEVSNITMYYTDAVLDELNSIKEIPMSLKNSKGLKIYTYYDKEAQDHLETSIISKLRDTELQTASIMADPDTGGIIALAGGKNYSISEYNRATKAKRQVGSTMKSFLYYAALENNFVSSSTFTSEKTTFNLANNKVYSPKNYNDNYANGSITMAAAIALSDNIYAVKTNLFLGPEKMIEVTERCGIKEKLEPIASLALGTIELNMKDYLNGYLAFASGGYKRNAHLIRKVEDGDGNVLYSYQNHDELILNPNYTYILNEMLTNTYNEAFKSYAIPSALSIKNKISKKYAIKTGTTNTDYWISGYNPNAILMVWTGYDDNRNVSNNDSNIAKDIWVITMENYLKDKKNKWYDKPNNVVATLGDSITGKDITDKSKSALYYYVKGTESMTFQEQKKDS